MTLHITKHTYGMDEFKQLLGISQQIVYAESDDKEINKFSTKGGFYDQESGSGWDR